MSLQRRLVLAASVVLVAFLGLTGAALDRAFRDSGLETEREQLLTRVYALIAAADLDDAGRLVLPAELPDPALSTPASGVYAQVRDAAGAALWRSRSATGTTIEFPAPSAPGEPAFAATRSGDGRALFALAFTVRWELMAGAVHEYRFEVARTRVAFEAQQARFRRSLWGWLAGAAALLLTVQGAILRWGLAPLGRLAREISEIEAGRRERVAGQWPAEIAPLAHSLNALIGTGRTLIERHRNALGALAHSLKTPLAVLRNECADDPRLRARVEAQIERMDRTIEYHLRRASTAGGGVLGARVDIGALAARMREALRKAHADKTLDIDIDTPAECHFRGDEGDLIEIFGNLLDNACKWARHRVRLSVGEQRDAGRATLAIEVEDDGPGIAAEDRARVLDRGARADPAVAGHGVGLAVVRDLVCGVYRGEIEIDRAALGGARVRVRLDAVNEDTDCRAATR